MLLKFFLTALRTLIFFLLKLEVELLYLVPIIDEFFPNQCLRRILLQLIKRDTNVLLIQRALQLK